MADTFDLFQRVENKLVGTNFSYIGGITHSRGQVHLQCLECLDLKTLSYQRCIRPDVEIKCVRCERKKRWEKYVEQAWLDFPSLNQQRIDKGFVPYTLIDVSPDANFHHLYFTVVCKKGHRQSLTKRNLLGNDCSYCTGKKHYDEHGMHVDGCRVPRDEVFPQFRSLIVR